MIFRRKFLGADIELTRGLSGAVRVHVVMRPFVDTVYTVSREDALWVLESVKQLLGLGVPS